MVCKSFEKLFVDSTAVNILLLLQTNQDFPKTKTIMTYFGELIAVLETNSSSNSLRKRCKANYLLEEEGRIEPETMNLDRNLALVTKFKDGLDSLEEDLENGMDDEDAKDRLHKLLGIASQIDGEEDPELEQYLSRLSLLKRRFSKDTDSETKRSLKSALVKKGPGFRCNSESNNAIAETSMPGKTTFFDNSDSNLNK
jgi:hypothetical protein